MRRPCPVNKRRWYRLQCRKARRHPFRFPRTKAETVNDPRPSVDSLFYFGTINGIIEHLLSIRVMKKDPLRLAVTPGRVLFVADDLHASETTRARQMHWLDPLCQLLNDTTAVDCVNQ